MSLFLIIDLFKDVDYSIVLLTRTIVLMGALIIMWLSTRKITPREIALCIVVIVLLNFGAALTTATYARMPSYYITNLLFLIFVLVVTASGLHFRYSLYINLTCLIVFLVYSQWINQNPFYYTQYPHLFSIFIYITIVGIVLEDRRRKNFLQFNDLLEQKRLVEELNQQKNRVISILSHDIGAPMNSLSKVLNLRTNGDQHGEQMKALYSGLANEISNVSYLLNGLVRWSRSQMQGFVLSKTQFELSSLIIQKRELFNLQLNEKQLTLELDMPSLQIKADEEMIRIVLHNLLSNAIRFADPCSRISIKLHRPQGRLARIEITNRGKQIHDEFKGKLFSYQMPISEDTDGNKGVGLGLAIAAFFIRLHDGQIQLEPSSNGTTTFVVEIPVSA